MNEKPIKLRIFDWQYYWHYRLQVELNHSDPGGWAFYALWIFNGFIILGLGFLANALFEPVKMLYEGQDQNYILFVIFKVALAAYLTRLIYGSEKHRIKVVQTIEQYDGKERYAWFALLYPFMAGFFCWYMFYLDGKWNY